MTNASNKVFSMPPTVRFYHTTTETLSVLVLSDGTRVYFGEDDAVIQYGGPTGWVVQYKEGTHKEADKYMSNPSLMHSLRYYEIGSDEAQAIRAILTLAYIRSGLPSVS